jgi:integrase
VKNKRVSLAASQTWQGGKRGGIQQHPKADGRRRLYLDLKQRRALLKAAKGLELPNAGPARDLIEAAALTGARPGELKNALVSQFDSRTKTMRFIGKTDSRDVPLSPAAATLFTRLAKGKQPTDHLFVRDDGTPWPASEWTELVREAAKAAELPSDPNTGVCLYTLRHSFITATLLGGMPTLEVARLTGTSLQMIEENYGHLVANAARQRLAKVAML